MEVYGVWSRSYYRSLRHGMLQHSNFTTNISHIKLMCIVCIWSLLNELVFEIAHHCFPDPSVTSSDVQNPNIEKQSKKLELMMFIFLALIVDFPTDVNPVSTIDFLDSVFHRCCWMHWFYEDVWVTCTTTMGKRRVPDVYRAPFPLYSIKVDPKTGLVITAGGGGASKTGIKNAVVSTGCQDNTFFVWFCVDCVW